MDCVFCKIIVGEIPGMKVYEDERSLIFMDIARDVDGHMLAVPKKHVKSLFDCDADALTAPPGGGAEGCPSLCRKLRL